jgi:uncharacterized protein YndB with AHSA1/START domain
MATADKTVSAQRVIAAPPEKIFDILADPAKHALIDGSGTVQHPQGRQPQRLALGAKFGMSMRMGLPYAVRNEVVEFDEGRRIAWRHFAHNIWRYELQPVEGGTRVVETFDWSRSRLGWFVTLMNFPKKNAAAIEQTLERLDRLVTTGTAG